MKPAQERAVKLAAWMKANNRYRVGELARAVGMQPSSLSAILRGKRYVSLERVEALEAAAYRLGVEPQKPKPKRPRQRTNSRATGEARRMALELARVLKRTGNYDCGLLAEQTAALGWPMRQDRINGVLTGSRAASVYAVEHIALAAGVDLAFLYPDRPIDYMLTQEGVAATEPAMV